MRLMHFADLHLDSPFSGLQKSYPQIQQALIRSPYRAFEEGITYAITQEVDAVVIAGDVYDTQKQTIYAQYTFNQQMKRLEEAGIPVILCHGNHDYLNSQRRLQQYPENVYVFDEETVGYVDITCQDQTTCRFYGFSYWNKWIDSNKSLEFPINPRETTYTVGIYHGALIGSEEEAGQYAPFKLEDLKERRYDYWALGHIHAGNRLSEAPLIQYAGSIQGRNRLEIGPKGAYLVTLTPAHPSEATFIPLSKIIWVAETIECQQDWQASQLAEAIHEMIHNYHIDADAGKVSYLISLTLANAQRLSLELQDQIQKGELDAVIMEPLGQEPFVAVVKMTMDRQMVVEAFEYDLMLNQSYKQACLDIQEDDTYDQIMKDFQSHPLVNKWLKDLVHDSDNRAEIIETAQKMMIQHIGFEFKEARNHED